MPDMPKVAHLAYSINQSDLKDLITALIYKQKENGGTADIIHIVNETDTSTVLKIKGIDVYTYTKSRGTDLRLLFKLAKFFRTHRYQVVHAHSPEIAVLAGAAARLSRTKSIYSCHWMTHHPVPALARRFNNYVVTACEYLQKKLLNEKTLHDRKVKVIYDGIDEQIYMKGSGGKPSLENRRKLGLKEDSFIIGNIGALVKEEDQATLIKAFRKLRAKGLNTELVFAGEGPLLGDLRKLSENYDLLNHVRFIPKVLSRAEYLQLFDVLVHSGHKETYPFNLLEAMAAGTPVIATKIGANAEVIDERKTGYLVPCGFPERIDSAVMRLNAIKTLPREMGEHSQKHIQNGFTIDRMAAKYQELYTS